jgi:hypothetical protein
LLLPFESLKNLVDLGKEVPDRMQKVWKQWVPDFPKEEKEMPLKEWFLWLLLIGSILFFQHLANFSISIDDEVTAFRPTAKPMVGQGRWGFYLIETFILDQPIVPFLPYFLYMITMIFSYFIIVKIYNFRFSYFRLISFPIFIGYPIYSFALEFNQLPFPLSLGILSVLISVYLVNLPLWNERGRYWRKLLIFIFISFLVSFSVSIYQALLFLFLVASLSVWFFKEVKFSDLFSHFLRLAGVAFFSVFLYWGILRLFLYFLHLDLDYIQEFVNLDLLVSRPLDVFERFFSELSAVYSGSEKRFGASLSASKFIVCLSFFVIVFKSSLNQNFLRIPLFLIILVIPFSMNILSGSEMPLRSLVSIPFVLYIFFEIILAQKLWLFRFFGWALGGLMFFQILNTLSRYQAIDQIRINHDRQMIQQVYEAIVSVNPRFNRDSTYYIDFYGYKSIPIPAYLAPISSTVNGSIFQWDNGNPDRIAYFLRLHGYGRFRTISPKRRERLKAEYEKMNIWPDKGSVKKKGPLTMIRLGK